MASKLYCEFNEATQLKTSLVKNSIKFNDLAVQMRPHRIAYLRLLGRHITVCEKVCGQTIVYPADSWNTRETSEI